MKSTIRAGLAGLVAALALVGCGKKQEAAQPAADAGQAPAAAAPAEEKVVNVYNWSDYIDPKMLEQFTAETGIKVNYDVFDSNEVLQTKLLAGNTGYDVVVPSASFLETQIKAGVFRKLDRSKLPNWSNLDQNLLQRIARHDPGNEYAVNHLWGTDAIGFNVKKVKAIDPSRAGGQLGADPRPEVGREVQGLRHFHPRCAGRGGGRRARLPRQGPEQREPRRPEGRRRRADEDPPVHPHDPQLAVHRFAGERRHLRGASAGAATSCRPRSRAAEAGQGVEIAMSVPKEGTIIWFDMYAIPADAPHPDNAHAFINFMMKPEVAAANSNFVHYASGNAAAVPLLDPGVRDDPGVYPPPEVMAKLFPNLARSPEFTRALNRTWTRFTTGK